MCGIRVRLFASAAFGLMCATFAAAQSRTTTYTYDAIGRLTFIEDSQNGNRDFDYDSAGNRLRVTVGASSDGAAEPASSSPAYVPGTDPLARVIPARPSNLFKSYVNECAWRTTWTLSQGATYYTSKTASGRNSTIYPTNSSGSTTVQIAGNTITVIANCPYGESQAYEPASVKACSADGCSDAASF